ncbi:MAG: SUMF1/EgtB/PvdO family nonheme iron enzyme [Fibrobacteres bacterium]|nr:SUMF1/EgtB/PvdO family nonheme iron enzyme [Fibrobacterota bacterium]
MRTKLLIVIALLFCLQCGFFVDLGTNVDKTGAAIYGWVKDSISGQPLSGIQVAVPGKTDVILTDSDGFFAINGLYTGEKTVSLYAVGYQTITMSIPLTAGVKNLKTISLLRSNSAPVISEVLYPKPNQTATPLSLKFKVSVSEPDFQNLRSIEKLNFSLCIDTVQNTQPAFTGTINWPETKQSATIFLPNKYIYNLKANKQYYWKISVKDTMGGESQSFSGTFTTRDTTDICPSGMASIELEDNRFCMDKYEVTNRDYANFTSTAGIDSEHTEDASFSSGPSKPVTNVRFVKADEYCRFYLKRLCSPSQWLIATGGAEQNLYPYGNTYDQTKCNTAKTAFQNPADGGGADSVGANPDCVSPYGVYDLSGNVSEWIYYGDNVAYAEDWEGKTSFVFAGGSWSSGRRSGSSARDTLTFDAGSTYYRQEDVGFRCCSKTRPK